MLISNVLRTFKTLYDAVTGRGLRREALSMRVFNSFGRSHARERANSPALARGPKRGSEEMRPPMALFCCPLHRRLGFGSPG